MIMTDPVANPVIVFAGFIIIAGAVIFEMLYDPWRSKRAAAFNIAASVLILLSLFFMNLRPYIPGAASDEEGVDAEFKDIDVVFVVDNTLSMKATDEKEGSRKKAMIADAKRILEELPGCSATVISFANQAKVMTPFTTDTISVVDALETMYPPEYYYAQGTDLSMPFSEVVKSLNRRVEHDGHKMTLLFFMSDGENTNGGKVPNATSLSPYIAGGGVIGYGTKEGSTMDDGFGGKVWDPETYEPAVTYIDEDALKTVAKQLGVEYAGHKEIDDIVNDARKLWEAAPSYNGMSMLNAASRTEFYYYFAIPLIIGLVMWMSGAARENSKAVRVLGKNEVVDNG